MQIVILFDTTSDGKVNMYVPKSHLCPKNLEKRTIHSILQLFLNISQKIANVADFCTNSSAVRGRRLLSQQQEPP